MFTLPIIPANSILGLNYSGRHDSAIAIVSPDGEPVFALSLERITRIKQDGRSPQALLESIPFEQIDSVAISTESVFSSPERWQSRILDNKLPLPRDGGLHHTQPFYDFLESIPCRKEFVCHELAHAASAFWLSDFHESICLTYDGGMFNSPWFGGVYSADREKGLQVLDQFSALHYSKVTTLYTFITALLGFTPNKHEGKITGLAAYGQSNASSRKLIHHWFYNRFLEIESVMDWVFPYDDHLPALLLVDESKMDTFRQESSCFTREELAATVQEFAEGHVLDLLRKIRALGWSHENICLAGGLFANVKINHRVLEIGFRKLFVAPPMTDDGTALGAALQAVWLQHKPTFKNQCSMFLGPCYTKQAIQTTLREEGIQYQELSTPEEKLAILLAEGAVIGVFQGNMEFGPRALGHRSILSQATNHNINSILNARLGRTEFMPFAPITREEDAFFCYQNIESVCQAIDFMTVTVNCTEEMLSCCPAVVHVDGTARPQIVHKNTSPFIHSVLTHYKAITGIPALINTSFNIHEEPIVCSPQDALRGFYGARLDYLYFEGGFMISYQENHEVALRYLHEAPPGPRLKSRQWSAVLRMRNEHLKKSLEELTAKETVIQSQAQLICQQEKVINRLNECCRFSKSLPGNDHLDLQNEKPTLKTSGTLQDPVQNQHGQELDYRIAAEIIKLEINPTIIDIGVERGSFIDLALSAGAGQIIGFECLPRHLEYLSARFREEPKIEIHPLAISNQSGISTLHIAVNPNGNELDFHHTLSDLGDSSTVIRSARQMAVRIASLSDLSKEGIIPEQISFLKIDTDGHDLAVLQGLANLRPKAIMVEYWDTLPETSGVNPYTLRDLIEWADTHGYSRQIVIRRHQQIELVESGSSWSTAGDWGNAFFLRDDFNHLTYIGIVARYSQESFETISSQFCSLDHDRKAKEAEIRRLDEALTELRGSNTRMMQTLQEQIASKENEIQRLHCALSKIHSQNETKEAELLRLSAALGDLRAQLEAKEDEIIRLDNGLDELRNQNNAKEEEIKLLDTALTELKKTNKNTIFTLTEKLDQTENQSVQIRQKEEQSRLDYESNLQNKEDKIEYLYKAFQELREASERERQSLRIQLKEKEDLLTQFQQEDKRLQLEFLSRLRAKEEIILDQRHALNAYHLLSKLEEKEPLLEQIQRTTTQENNHLQVQLEEKEKVIVELSRALEAYRSAFNILGRITSPWKSVSLKLRSLVQPRIGNLYQHPPKDIALPSFYRKPTKLTTSPKISMVTPSYGQADFIERTLKSVLDQKYPNLEYFVQDGGSKDGTKEILTRYSMQLSGWESAPDNGQSHAINLGFQKTTGEIMAWLNSDDVLLPGALAYIADYFNRHPKVDVIYGHRLLIDENDKLIGRWMLPAHDNKALSWADFIPQETLFWRRRIWEKIGGKVDQSFQFAIDWDLLVRFREAGAVFARLPRFLGGFRVHSQQKTSATITDLGFQEMNRIRQRIHGYLPSPLEIRKALIAYTGKHLLVDVIWRIRRLLGFPS